MSEIQDIIVREMKVKPSIDSKLETRNIIQFIKNYIQSHSFIKSLVLGISGGQDSTLAGKLCQIAINELKEKILIVNLLQLNYHMANKKMLMKLKML